MSKNLKVGDIVVIHNSEKFKHVILQVHEYNESNGCMYTIKSYPSGATISCWGPYNIKKVGQLAGKVKQISMFDLGVTP